MTHVQRIVALETLKKVKKITHINEPLHKYILANFSSAKPFVWHGRLGETEHRN